MVPQAVINQIWLSLNRKASNMRNLTEKVSLVMPAFNEGRRIVQSIEVVAETFRDFGCSWELIVMDDGSMDDTYENACSLIERYPCNLVVKKCTKNYGKGRVLKKALRYVSGEYCVFLDADMDLHPRQIQTFFDILNLDNADIVIGSKFHSNSVVQYPLHRRVISFGYYLFVKALFGLPCHDTQTGLKVFRTEVLRKVFPRILVKKFAFDLEVLVNAYALKYKIVEAPVVLRNQRYEQRIGLQAIFNTWWDTLAVFYRMRILRYYDNINYHRRKNLAKEFRRMRK